MLQDKKIDKEIKKLSMLQDSFGMLLAQNEINTLITSTGQYQINWFFLISFYFKIHLKITFKTSPKVPYVKNFEKCKNSLIYIHSKTVFGMEISQKLREIHCKQQQYASNLTLFSYKISTDDNLDSSTSNGKCSH